MRTLSAAEIALAPRPGSDAADRPDKLTEKNGRWLLAERLDAAADRLERLAALLG